MATETIPERESVKQIVVELPESLVKALKIAAIERGTTQKQIVAAALRRELQVRSVGDVEFGLNR